MAEVLMIAGAIVLAGFLIDLAIIGGRRALARRRERRDAGQAHGGDGD